MIKLSTINTPSQPMNQNKLTRCKACGREVNFVGRVCPKCGTARKKGCLSHCIVAVFIVLVLSIVTIIAVISSEHTKKQDIAADTIPYKVVRKWTFPIRGQSSMGLGENIAVTPEQASKYKLVKFGEQLHREYYDLARVVIWIFSDEEAARLAGGLSKLSAADELYCDQHFIGKYEKDRTVNPDHHISDPDLEEYEYYPYGARDEEGREQRSEKKRW